MSSQHDNVLEQEPSAITHRAEEIGADRLDRTNLDVLITAIIGGGEVSVGSLAAMTVVGAALTAFPGINLYAALALGGIVFPIGFLFVIVGRSELFTENFLIPVVAVFTKERTLGSLVALWGLSWLGNIIGCAGASVLFLVPEAIGEPIHLGFQAYTSYKLELGIPGVLASAMLAGGVMTAMTWMLLAVEHPVARMIAIWAGGYVLFAANLSHSIVSASVVMVGFLETGFTLVEVVRWMALATVGNLVGGVGLVTLFRLTQAHQQTKTQNGRQ